MAADWPLPTLAVTLAGAPGVLVRVKVALLAPVVDAMMLTVPATVLAVKVEAVATPLELVTAVVVAVLLAKVPLAPEAGAVKVTVTPGMGLPLPSFTVAWSAVV